MKFNLHVMTTVLSTFVVLPAAITSQDFDLSCHVADESLLTLGDKTCEDYQVKMDQLMRDFMCIDDDTDSVNAIKDFNDELEKIKKDKDKKKEDLLREIDELEGKLAKEQKKLEKAKAKQEKKDLKEAAKQAEKKAKEKAKAKKKTEKRLKDAIKDAEKAIEKAIKDGDKDKEEAAKTKLQDLVEKAKAKENEAVAAEKLAEIAYLKIKAAEEEEIAEYSLLRLREQELKKMSYGLENVLKDAGSSRRSLRQQERQLVNCRTLCFGFSKYCSMVYPMCELPRDRELSDYLPSFMKTEYIIDEEQMFGNNEHRGLHDTHDIEPIEEMTCQQRVNTLKSMFKVLSAEIENENPQCAQILRWDCLKCACKFTK